MQEQSDHEIMAIHVAQTEHAFRVNGVTIAKRHLARTLAEGAEVDDKILSKYLVIVPFLATTFELNSKSSESVRYGAIKAKRLYKALKLTEENVMPFMMVFLAQAEGENSASPKEAIQNVSNTLRRNGFYEGGKPTSFHTGETSQFPSKRTLH